MQKSLRALLAILGLSFLAQFALADDILIATGDSKNGSAYSRMFRELMKVCPAADIKERETKGSVENLDLIANNEVQGALLQGDFLTYWNRKSPDRVANIKTLFPLHQEELHYIARADVKKVGGFMGFGGKEVYYDSLNDLKGRKLGAVGGSVITANVVSDMSGLGYQTVTYADNGKLVESLKAKEIDAILIVGGAQNKLVGELPADFKVLPIPQDIRDKLAKVYKSVELNYSNLNAVGVKSLATPAYFVVYNFDDPALAKQLLTLRACFKDQAPKIGNKPGTFAKWRQVKADDQGTWSYYTPAVK